MKNKIPPINYDESWKYILTTLFKSGLDFFLQRTICIS